MLVNIILIPLLLFPFFFPSGNLEQKKEEETKAKIHHEIVVTATRLETQAFKVGNCITVISGEELKKKGFITIAEALAQLTSGFLIRNGGAGSATSFLIRGSNAEHTLVLIDGVEVNDPMTPSRSSDLAHLLVADVDRIEILDGPQSPLYGSDVMGGVINIILKKKGEGRFSWRSEVGSFKTANLNLSISGQARKTRYYLAAGGYKTAGISAASSTYAGNLERDGYRNATFSGQINYSLSPRSEVSCLFRYFNSKTDLDRFGGPYGDDPNYTQNWQASLFKLSFHSFQFNNFWEQKIYLAFVANNRKYNNEEDEFHLGEKEKGSFKSSLLKFDWQNNLHFSENNILTFGLETEREEGESTYIYSSFWGENKSFFPRKQALSIGLYCQQHVSLARFAFTTAGLRLDHHSRSGLSFTYRLAQSFWWERTLTKLRASLASGFKSPSLYQLHAPAMLWGPVGNPELKPEKCFAWDLGFEQDFPGFIKGLSLTYFRHSFHNLIQFDFLQGYQNVGRARTSGWRFKGGFEPSSIFNLRFDLGWLEARDLSSGEKLLRRPRFQGKIDLELEPSSRWKFLVTFLRTGSREDLDYSRWPAQRITLSPFTLVNINLIYLVRPGFSLHLRAENVTNSRYELVKGYGTPGFSLYTGFSLIL